MKRVRWKLIDKFFPRDGKVDLFYARRRGTACQKCGRCCSLLRTSADLEYFREVIRRWRSWSRIQGKPIPKGGRDSIKAAKFFLENFVRVNRIEAQSRGFVKEINNDDFFYHCLGLKADGSCSVYDNGRPILCTGYPFYDEMTFPKGTKKGLSKVLETCGFAGDRKARRNR